MIKAILIFSFLILIQTGCAQDSTSLDKKSAQKPSKDMHIDSEYETAILAGGCFWCIQSDLDKIEGVFEVESGYSGGDTSAPTYEDVSSGTTSHLEVVKIYYDPKKISYKKLLQVFIRLVDPTQGNGQFCDIGDQYRSAIFYENDSQKKDALSVLEEAKEEIQKRHPDKTIKTLLLKRSDFWRAEEYHQDYYKKKPVQYCAYREGCRRDQQIKSIWGSD